MMIFRYISAVMIWSFAITVEVDSKAVTTPEITKITLSAVSI